MHYKRSHDYAGDSTRPDSLHPDISTHILHSVRFVSRGKNKENLFNSQNLLEMAIIFLTLVNLIMRDSEVILSGEIKCETLSCIKGFKGGQLIHQYSFHTKYCL